ncbi:MAG: phage holin family protein [Proteobacteria bacterium]|nr:phage holin family protein [Pseudomonadota bacterium]
MTTMMSQSGALLNFGLKLKISQIKRALRSYAHDRAAHTKSVVSSYMLACALYAAAGLFLLSTLFVGVFALFRWIELTYGQFEAFAAIGGLLLLLTALCALFAAFALHPRPARYPALTKRLQTAIKSNPVQPSQIAAVRDTTAAILVAPPTPHRRRRARSFRQSSSDNGNLHAGLILTAALLGWAVVRRRGYRQDV